MNLVQQPLRTCSCPAGPLYIINPDGKIEIDQKSFLFSLVQLWVSCLNAASGSFENEQKKFGRWLEKKEKKRAEIRMKEKLDNIAENEAPSQLPSEIINYLILGVYIPNQSKSPELLNLLIVLIGRRLWSELPFRVRTVCRCRMFFTNQVRTNGSSRCQ